MGEAGGFIFGRSLQAGKVTDILSRLEALSGKERALLEREEPILWAPFNPESRFLKSLDLRPRGLTVRGSPSQPVEVVFQMGKQISASPKHPIRYQE